MHLFCELWQKIGFWECLNHLDQLICTFSLLAVYFFNTSKKVCLKMACAKN